MRTGISRAPVSPLPMFTPRWPKLRPKTPTACKAASPDFRAWLTTVAYPPGEVAPALCVGAAALGRGDNAQAAGVLETALLDLPRIGGSHAQREVFEDSLIVAYLRSGQSAKAAPLLRARLGRRPSTRDKAWLALCSGDGTGG